MKKKLSLTCTLIALLVFGTFFAIISGCSSNSSTNDKNLKEFEDGEGTESSPYVIAQDYQWQNINKHLNSYFILKNDIYLEDLGTITPIGSTSEPFEGKLDGNNFTVSNATISIDDECGLFGCISNGEVRNLNFSNSSLKLNVTGDGAYIGSFVANLKKGSIVENCHTKNITMTEIAHGSILGYPKFYAAGFVGIVQSASKIIYCSCNVKSNAGGNRIIYLSGFVGKMNGGVIDACHCSGSFDSNPSSTGGGNPSNSIGGFVYSFLAGTITNVYTETLFNYVGSAGMFTYENMDDLDYILSFIEFGHTSKNLGTKLYYKADIINNAIELSGCRYYSPDRIMNSNDILDSKAWETNKIWVKGKIHPEFVSYEKYKELKDLQDSDLTTN